MGVSLLRTAQSLLTGRTIQVCLQDLNWVQYSVSYCLCYIYGLKDKISEDSAKHGA